MEHGLPDRPFSTSPCEFQREETHPAPKTGLSIGEPEAERYEEAEPLLREARTASDPG